MMTRGCIKKLVHPRYFVTVNRDLVNHRKDVLEWYSKVCHIVRGSACFLWFFR